MLLYNLKLVLRNLLKNKLYSFLSITGFAIGFAVCIVIALFTYNEYTVDHCYPNYSRIYRLVDEKAKKCNIDYNLNAKLADNNPEVELACPFESEPFESEFPVKYTDRYTKTIGLISTNNIFFKLFSVRVVKAISNEPFSDKQSAIITESLAKKLFKKDESPLGKPIYIFNEYNAIVSAVVEDFPENSSIKATVILNSENEEFRFNRYCNDHKCINPVNQYLLIDERVNPNDFAAKLNQNISTYKFAIDSIGIQGLSDIYLQDTIKGSECMQGNRNLIIVLMAIGVLIMLLSIVNYLNYNLSIQYSKLKEIGIKRINGADFRHLVGYFFTEVSVGILISIDFALIIVWLALPYINSLLGKQLNLEVLTNPYMLAISTAVVIIIIIINSIAPLYILLRFNISSFFAGKSLEKGQSIGRNIFTAFQFASAIALLICVLIIQKQLVYAQDADLGFNKEQLLRLSLPMHCSQQQLLKQEINKLPFVVSSTLSSGVPGGIGMSLGSMDSAKHAYYLSFIVVDPDFLKTMNIELTDGRWFLNGDLGRACIMNQEAIKQFGWRNIDNKRFNNGIEGGYAVVGVVKDFHIGSFHRAIQPLCIGSCAKDDYSGLPDLSIRITPGEVKSKLQKIKGVWDKIIPEDPMDFTFYDTLFDAMYRKEKLLATIIMIFSVIAIVLSCMGVLGQIFQTCINRTKEIGIRKVNGASTWMIIRLLNSDFVKLVVIVFLIACPVSYYIMNKWLQNFAYKTELNWWIFALAGIVVLAISFITVTWQSWRAASRNPVEALKYE